MIVSHSLRCIFVSNPKTGSKSIEAALGQFQDEPQLNETSKSGLFTRCHMPAYALRATLGPSVWNQYFKFSFVRNPWDWFVSQHFYNSRKAGDVFRVDEPMTANDILNSYHFLCSYRGAEWEESASQHAFTCDEQGEILVDFLGRFESLREDFCSIQSVIGTQLELPHVNSSTHRYYKEYYNDETTELVRRLYRRDVTLFSYDF